MAFTVQDFHDLVRLLEHEPGWRAEMRRLILSDEMIDMPRTLASLADKIEQLVDAQQRTDGRVEALVEAQQRTDEQIRALTARVDDLTVRLDTLTAHVDDLTVRLDTLTARIDALTERIDALAAGMERRFTKIDEDLGKLKGFVIEERYRARPFAYFRRILKRSRLLSVAEVDRLLAPAIEQGVLTDDEAEEILLADVIVRGRLAQTGEETFGLAEVSWGVGEQDVVRASQRAALLSRAGLRAIPVVAGEWITPDAVSASERLSVWRVLDGAAIEPGTFGP